MLTSSYYGSLVAFEGSSDSSISTQLRLLPVSPQILILPNILNYLPDETADSTFHAATFIRKVHDAAAARLEAAFNFLNGATPDSKRLVFLNGGTPSAYALCVKAIAQHETNGDFERAEGRLQAMIAGGLAGLSEVGKKNLQKRPSLSFASALDDADAFLFQDPITRAMRAADALDRQTESLQPSTDLDLTLSATRRPRPRSMSLPIYGYVDHLGDAAPFYLFGARAEGGGRGRASEEQAIDDFDEDNPGGRTFFLQSPRLELRSFYDEPDDIDPFKLDSSLKTPLSPRSPSCIGEAYWPPINSAIAQDDEDPVVLGEASIIHIAPSSASRRSLKRARSLDRMSMSRARYRDLPLRLPSNRETDQGFENLDGARRFSCVDIADERGGLPLSPTSTRASYVGVPRTVFVRRSSAAKIALLTKPKKERKTGCASYVDRGTDAEDIITAPAEDAREPVLPFREDLVVYFKNGRLDTLVDKFVQAFRDGSIYAPALVQPSRSEVSNNGGSEPETTAAHVVEAEQVHVRNQPCQEVISDRPSSDEEYDPFSYQKQPPPLLVSTSSCKPVIVSTTVTLSPSAPPTPAHTPPPPASPLHPVETTPRRRTIRDFAVLGNPTAVAVQNALRSLLAEYFPAEEDGFHQFNFHHLPELDGLWRPIFREAGSGSDDRHEEEGGSSSMRMMDQIIAFGSQAGVKREFVSSVGRRLEKLGAQPSGVSRSGRIDFR